MVEDIGQIISNGFKTYTSNLNLIVPFILDIFITGLLAVILIIFGFLSIFAPVIPSLENAAPEEVASALLPYLIQHILEIVLLIAIIYFVTVLVDAFFTAGAIGMAGQATETGRCELSTMMEAGKKNFMNLFLAEILVFLLYLAGIVFMVPGAVSIDLGDLSSPKNSGAVVLLVAGFLLFAVYLLILTLMLGVFRYALVVDRLGPVESIAVSYRFFRKHWVDVILLFLVMFAIGAVLFVIDQIMGVIPIINIIWIFVSFSISLFILPPLTTVWWVRLYMTRTDKKVYFNELLAHPKDL